MANMFLSSTRPFPFQTQKQEQQHRGLAQSPELGENIWPGARGSQAGPENGEPDCHIAGFRANLVVC